MSKIKLASILALLAGPFFIVMTYIETSQMQRIDREGVQTIAMPTAKIERKGRKGGRTYKIEVAYFVEGSGKRTEQVGVSHELYDRIESVPAITIKYLKADPSQIVVVGEPLGSPEMYWVGLGLFAFGALGGWWFFLRKRPVSAPLPEHA